MSSPQALIHIRQSDKGIAHNPFMDKRSLHQIFIANVRSRLKTSPIGTQLALSKKAGMSQSFLSEVLSGESVPSLTIVEAIAKAFGCQGWELLADSEATRQAALQRLLWGENASDKRVEEALGTPKEVASKRRKKGSGGESLNH